MNVVEIDYREGIYSLNGVRIDFNWARDSGCQVGVNGPIPDQIKIGTTLKVPVPPCAQLVAEVYSVGEFSFKVRLRR